MFVLYYTRMGSRLKLRYLYGSQQTQKHHLNYQDLYVLQQFQKSTKNTVNEKRNYLNKSEEIKAQRCVRELKKVTSVDNNELLKYVYVRICKYDECNDKSRWHSCQSGHVSVTFEHIHRDTPLYIPYTGPKRMHIAYDSCVVTLIIASYTSV